MDVAADTGRVLAVEDRSAAIAPSDQIEPSELLVAPGAEPLLLLERLVVAERLPRLRIESRVDSTPFM